MKKICDKSTIIDEHFWFTAITLGFNAFILEKMKDNLNDSKIIIAACVINLYAIFLILHRAAEHANRLKYPKWLDKKVENEKLFYHKGLETLVNIWITIKMLPIVIFEFSGALFYLLLILFSFFGIILK